MTRNEKLKAARDALQNCKAALWDGGDKGGSSYICIALEGPGAEFAKDIVERSINGYYTYDGWLKGKIGYRAYSRLTPTQIQGARCRLVNRLIRAIDKELRS